MHTSLIYLLSSIRLHLKPFIFYCGKKDCLLLKKSKVITRWGRFKEEKLFCMEYSDRAIPDQKNTLDFLQFLESGDKKRDYG